MPSLASNPSFLIYSIVMLVLSVNMLALWVYSGSVRTKTQTTPNPEDAVTVVRGASVIAGDPPEVARVLRAHRNAADNIVPFAILAFLYIVYGASPLATGLVCGLFGVARLGHSYCYLRGLQPWRTVAFTVGGLDTLVLIGLLIRALVQALR